MRYLGTFGGFKGGKRKKLPRARGGTPAGTTGTSARGGASAGRARVRRVPSQRATRFAVTGRRGRGTTRRQQALAGINRTNRQRSARRRETERARRAGILPLDRLGR